ncbi:ankyrin repeat domain-containing protein [candidate division KSB1 bacterium]|nr:ankyrin repeat domain-containing protein [candidate division KSB1 bacterium]
MNDAIEQIKEAFHKDDAASVRELLERYPELKTKINDPLAAFDAPAIVCVRSREMLDVLLAAGADINAKSRWWAGGFGLLHSANPELAAYAIERGAIVDVHAAARLGMLEKLAELVAADPELVHARGGDGQTPLHFASTIEIAEYLLDHGAAIDARDVDHESTPAQWMMRDRQDIVRYLISRGCKTDILMASALGDLDLVRRHFEANPDSIRLRVSDEYFPMVGGKNGGTIYQWTLGWYVSAHQVAKDFGHEHIFEFLMERSPDEIKLITACWLGDEATMAALLVSAPNLATRLRDPDRRQLAHAARNNDLTAVRLMAAIGLPVDASSQHGATPLHWAAFHGNVEMIELILRKNPPMEVTDTDFNGTPLGWAIYGSEHGWQRGTGNYAATVEALIDAGAKPPQEAAGSAEVRQALLRQGQTK